MVKVFSSFHEWWRDRRPHRSTSLLPRLALSISPSTGCYVVLVKHINIICLYAGCRTSDIQARADNQCRLPAYTCVCVCVCVCCAPWASDWVCPSWLPSPALPLQSSEGAGWRHWENWLKAEVPRTPAHLCFRSSIEGVHYLLAPNLKYLHLFVLSSFQNIVLNYSSIRNLWWPIWINLTKIYTGTLYYGFYTGK